MDLCSGRLPRFGKAVHGTCVHMFSTSPASHPHLLNSGGENKRTHPQLSPVWGCQRSKRADAVILLAQYHIVILVGASSAGLRSTKHMADKHGGWYGAEDEYLHADCDYCTTATTKSYNSTRDSRYDKTIKTLLATL